MHRPRLTLAVTATALTIASVALIGRVSQAAIVGSAPGAHHVTHDSSKSRLKRPKKTKHFGMRADGHGDWESCAVVHTPGRPEALSMTTTGTGAALKLTPTPDEIQALADAAFATCFLQDSDPEGPSKDGNETLPEWQHEDSVFEVDVNGSKQSLPLRVRAASEVWQMPIASLAKNRGYISADYLNMSTHLMFANVISPFHSALLWLGVDSNLQRYAAIIDLGDFPSTNGVKFTTLKIGTLDVRPLDDKKKRQVAFARFSDPHGTRVPDGTWVDCPTGCCLVTGLTLLRGPASEWKGWAR